MTKAPDGFVLDCSVTMAWCFVDEATPYTRGVLDRLDQMRAVVPSLWPLEVANVALVGERRGRLDEARTTRFFALLDALPITVDDQTRAKAFAEIIHPARIHHLSVYDPAYLELAIRLDLPLASLDGKLKTAAQSAGVVIFEV